MSAAALVVRLASPDELAACLAVRHAVFVVGQGVPEELEVDGLDPASAHLVATLDGAVVGTARLRVVDGHGKAERVAVLEAHRGRGLGIALMRALEAEASAKGLPSVHLHAQLQVVGFYRDLGYVAHGAPFDEAGIGHVAMEKRLG